MANKTYSFSVPEQEYIPQTRFVANIVKSMRVKIKNPRVTVYSTKTTVEVSMPDYVNDIKPRRLFNEVVNEILARYKPDEE